MEKIQIDINVFGDEIGPELIIKWYDPELNVKGVMVVDSLALGMATGGTRMLSDINTSEICLLARAMTYKKATMGVPVGGAKAGIWADPNTKGEARYNIFKAFGKALRPLFNQHIVRYGEDMGVNHTDIEIVGKYAGYPPPPKTSYSKMLKDGEPLENHFTGYGVVVAARSAFELDGKKLENASVAIEGFGKVGGGVARYMDKEGARIVAISTIEGAIYNKNGININEIIELRKEYGDDCIKKYKDAEKIQLEDIFYLPVEVLVPGGRPYVINEKNVDKVKAKVISSGANVPITDTCLDIFHKKGVLVIPDFISNSGGSTAGLSRRSGLNPDETFVAIDRIIGKNTVDILEKAKSEKINPTSLAIKMATDKVRKAKRGESGTITHEIALKKFRELVNI